MLLKSVSHQPLSRGAVQSWQFEAVVMNENWGVLLLPEIQWCWNEATYGLHIHRLLSKVCKQCSSFVSSI